MKYILIIFYIIFSSWTHAQNNLIINKQLKSEFRHYNYPSGAKFTIYKGEGSFQDNFGNYGNASCMGNIFTYTTNKVDLYVMCETVDQNNNKFYEKSIRKSEELNEGIGVTTIIEGTGPWQSLSGVKCNFAIKYKDNFGFVLSKCPLTAGQKNIMNESFFTK